MCLGGPLPEACLYVCLFLKLMYMFVFLCIDEKQKLCRAARRGVAMRLVSGFSKGHGKFSSVCGSACHVTGA